MLMVNHGTKQQLVKQQEQEYKLLGSSRPFFYFYCMGRGIPKVIIQTEKPLKFTRTYEDDTTTEVWTYDLNKSDGPVSVDIKYKNGADKKWAKEQKEHTRVKSEMRKIDKRNKK